MKPVLPPDGGAEAPRAGKMAVLRRLVPLFILIAAFIGFFAFGFDRYVSFEALRAHRAELTEFVAENHLMAAALFMILYAAATAVSLPGGAVLTIAGGFLFGTVFATVYVVLGATMGAVALFLAARTALGNFLRARAGGMLRRMEDGFRENAFSYLLFLRLIPVFPFWLVNLVPAFLGVPLRTYVLATAIGIVPGSFVYASVGNGLGAVFDAGKSPDLGIIFSPEILLPIIGMALLALLPVVYRKFRGRRDAADHNGSGA